MRASVTGRGRSAGPSQSTAQASERAKQQNSKSRHTHVGWDLGHVDSNRIRRVCLGHRYRGRRRHRSCEWWCHHVPHLGRTQQAAHGWCTHGHLSHPRRHARWPTQHTVWVPPHRRTSHHWRPTHHPHGWHPHWWHAERWHPWHARPVVRSGKVALE
jgi:hypothetical protein